MGAKDSFKVRFLFLSSLVLLISLVSTGPVSADAAPPQAPPGSSIATEDFETNVQMVSEEVIIEVGYYPGQDVSIYPDREIEDFTETEFVWGRPTLYTGDLYAHIDATFFMKNQGDQDEAFDVWFPIEANDGYMEMVRVINFQAWVNGVPSEITERTVTDEWEDDYLWAIWPATFPVGEEVIIRVSYDIPPTYNGPLRQFEYILETGAGWYDVIEQGTFIVRLPYEVKAENTDFKTTSREHLPIKWDVLLISGSKFQWEFTNYEPVEHVNVYLVVLAPTIWTEIQAARSIAAAYPDSLDAQLRLAQTLETAILTHHGIDSGWGFAYEAKVTYEHALELAPEDIDIYVAYLELLLSFHPPVIAPPEEFLPTLEHALELAPEDPRLLELEETYRIIKEMIRPTSDLTIQLSPTSLPTEKPSPSVYLSPTPQPTQTPIPTDVPTPENVSPLSNQGGIIPIIVIALIALLGIASRLLKC